LTLKNSNNGSIKSLRPLLPYIRKYATPLFVGFLFILIQNYCLVKIPFFLKTILDEIVSENRFYIISDLMIKVLLYVLVEAVSLYLMRKIIISVSRKIEYEIRQKLFNLLLNREYPFFLKNETGDISSRMTNDLNDVRILLGPAIMYVPNSLSRIVMFFPVLLGLSGTLMLIIIPILILLVLLILIILPKLRPKFKKIQETTAIINNRVWQTITGITTIKQNTLEKTESERFKTLNNDYIRVQLNMVKLRSIIRPLFMFLFSVIELIILYVGGGKVVSGTLTIGELLQFNIMVSALTFPILSLGWIMSMVQLGISAMERINYILKEPVYEKKDSVLVGDSVEIIEVKNLSFNYPGTEKRVLKDISMVVKKGDMVGITGEVGSGKSTFFDILSGLLTPDSGMITINGKDISDVDKSFLYPFFSVVSQNTFLFSGTIIENLSIGNWDPEIDEIRKNVSIASLDLDIDSFPDKYNQLVGERGITLSGGQKQRMSIARALCNPAPVLLLDDPLSSVDSETEERILSNLKKLRSDKTGDAFKTVFLISHRLSALKECDIIHVFKDGKIIESGNHGELIGKRGHYYLLSVMQQMGNKEQG